MAFWKKSEDPWDIDPEKKKKASIAVVETEPEYEQETEGFLAGIFKKKPAEEEVEESLICPWCGQKMTKGYLLGGRDRLRLSDQKPTAFLGSLGHDTIDFSDEGFLVTHKSCWQCKTCRKLVADIPEPETGPNYVREGGKVNLPEEEKTEEQE